MFSRVMLSRKCIVRGWNIVHGNFPSNCSKPKVASSLATRLALAGQVQIRNASFNSFPKSNNFHKWCLLFVGSLGSGFALVKISDSTKQLHCREAEQETSPQKEKFKDLKVTLYQYQTCPFCTKTRVFLQTYDIPHEIVEVHPIFKKELNSFKSKKVPQVIISQGGKDENLQDSSLIISVLSTYIANPGSTITDIIKLYPRMEEVDEEGKTKEVITNRHYIMDLRSDDKQTTETPEELKRLREEVEWRKWVDDHFVHIISPNVYRTYREAYQAFSHHVSLGKYNGTWEGWVAKIGGSVAMWLIAKKLKKKYKLQDDVRLDLYYSCNDWCDAVGDRKFMGGNKPNIADLNMYGAMWVMEGLDSFDDVMKYSKIKKWYYNTKKAIEANEAVDPFRYRV